MNVCAVTRMTLSADWRALVTLSLGCSYKWRGIKEMGVGMTILKLRPPRYMRSRTQFLRAAIFSTLGRLPRRIAANGSTA